jgi:hypothetical protein
VVAVLLLLVFRGDCATPVALRCSDRRFCSAFRVDLRLSSRSSRRRTWRARSASRRRRSDSAAEWRDCNTVEKVRLSNPMCDRGDEEECEGGARANADEEVADDEENDDREAGPLPEVEEESDEREGEDDDEGDEGEDRCTREAPFRSRWEEWLARMWKEGMLAETSTGSNAIAAGGPSG